MEAVLNHSKIGDPLGRIIFTSIAQFIPPNGAPSWASLREIARLSACDKDTVARWIPRLVESGEIESWTEGRGRGTKTWFKILLPIDGDNNLARGDNKLSNVPTIDGDNNSDNVPIWDINSNI